MVLTEKCEPSEIASRSSLRTEKIREIGGVFSSEPGLKSDCDKERRPGLAVVAKVL